MKLFKIILIAILAMCGFSAISSAVMAEGKQVREKEERIRVSDRLSYQQAQKAAREMRKASRELKELAAMDPPADLSQIDQQQLAKDKATVMQVANNLDQEASKWEEELQTLGDDAQLTNVDLQNMLQKQQQSMQMMSNISKMMHDTAMAIIRKIGG